MPTRLSREHCVTREFTSQLSGAIGSGPQALISCGVAYPGHTSHRTHEYILPRYERSVWCAFEHNEHDGLKQDGTPSSRIGTGEFAQGKVDPVEAGKQGSKTSGSGNGASNETSSGSFDGNQAWW